MRRRDATEQVRGREVTLHPFGPERVMDGARGMVLRHEQDVVVPELRLEQRPDGLLEPEPDEEVGELVQPGDVRVFPGPASVGHGDSHVVRPVAATFPGTRGEVRRGERSPEWSLGGFEREATSLLGGSPAFDRAVLGAHQAAALEGREDRFVEVFLLVRDLLEDDLLREKPVVQGVFVPQPEGEAVGQELSSTEDPDRGRSFLVRKSLRGRFLHGEPTPSPSERIKEAAFGKSVPGGGFAPGREPTDRQVLLVHDREVLRAQSLEAAPDLVGREARVRDDVFLIERKFGGLPQGREHPVFRG